MSGSGEVTIGTGGFPSTSQNRPRTDALLEISEYVGGADRPEVLTRAGRVFDSAVREFNMGTYWRFNRQRQTIPLAADTSDYTLNTDFYAPLAAVLLDVNGKSVDYQLEWVPYELFVTIHTNQQSGGDPPYSYTARNDFDAGLVTFNPRPVAPSTYPNVRLDYFSRIVVTSGNGKLRVPSDVEEAIMHLAIAKMIAGKKGFADAREAYQLALRSRAMVESIWRDYPDYF